MTPLQETLAQRIPVWRADLRDLVRRYGSEIVSEVTLGRLVGGLREVRAVLCDTSVVDPERGLFIRETPVRDLADCGAEELFYLMCTGERPDAAALVGLVQEIQGRRPIPEAVWQLAASLPRAMSPMRQFSIATLALGTDSVFRRRYDEGLEREALWTAALEDALTLMAQLPVLSAGLYRMAVHGAAPIPPDPALEYAENWAAMLGLEKGDGRFSAFLRRYVVVHSDHEGANASVLAARVVASAHADLYGSLSAAMNGLAGPLHGQASQTSLEFVRDLQNRFGDHPTEDQIAGRVEDLLARRRVIPGFGHAALRGPDPRFAMLRELGDALCPADATFQIVKTLERVVPPILKRQGKVKMPYPNVDAISGVLLSHFGVRDPGFLTVMFSTAQSVGLCAQLVLRHALMTPIIRPRSVTTAWLRQRVAAGDSGSESTSG